MSEKEEKAGLIGKNLLLAGAGVVIAIAVVVAVYFYVQYQQAQTLLKNPTIAAQQQTDALLSQVGKLIELPKGETPTVATVSDVSKLKGQAFFANAQNGDKVLIYTKAQKAILYRPSSNKIIDVAPVNIGQSVSTTPSVTPKATITPKATPSVSPTAAQ